MNFRAWQASAFASFFKLFEVSSFKLCMMISSKSKNLHTFIPLSINVIEFQGHSGGRKIKLKIWFSRRVPIE